MVTSIAIPSAILKIKTVEGIVAAIDNNKNYICSEVLADNVEWVLSLESGVEVEVDEDLKTEISIDKLN